ncbi:MAG: hypothetical protein AAGG07_09155 [Planctomycetota bacterium]
MTRTTRRVAGSILTVLVASLVLAPAPEVGAQERELRPPVPRETGEPPVIRTWLLLGVLIAGAVAATALPAKRNPED